MNIQTDELAKSDPFLRALKYRREGIATSFTVPGQKDAAVKWGKYVRQAPTIAETYHTFNRLERKYNSELGLLLVTGQEVNGKRLYVLDADSKAESEKRAVELAGTLQVKSSEGKLHAYFLSDKILATKLKPNGLDVDLKGFGSYVRAPFTLRDDGNRYLPTADKAEIKTINQIEGVPFEDSPVPRKQPSTFVWKVLTGDYEPVGKKAGKKQGEFASRSEAEYAAVLNMAQQGFTFEEIEWYFEHYAHKTKSKYKKIDKNDQSKNPTPAGKEYLREAFTSAIAFLQQQEEKRNTYEAIDNLVLFSQMLKWDWRGGSNELAVYNAFLRRAKAVNRLEGLAFSLDEISIESNLSKSGVRKVLKRFIGQYNLLSVEKYGTWNYATTYNLNTKPNFLVAERVKIGKRYYKKSISGHSYLGTSSLWDKGALKLSYEVLNYQDSDFFASKQGNTTYRIVSDILLTGATSLKELRNSTGCCYSTLHKHLDLLAKVGLVKKENKVYTLISTDFDTAAKLLLLDGTREKKRKNLELYRLDRYYQARLRYLKSKGKTVFNLVTGEDLS